MSKKIEGGTWTGRQLTAEIKWTTNRFGLSEYNSTGDKHTLAETLRAALETHDLIQNLRSSIVEDPFADPKYEGGIFPGYER